MGMAIMSITAMSITIMSTMTMNITNMAMDRGSTVTIKASGNETSEAWK